MKQQSLEQLEHDIEITLAFLFGDLTMKQWSYYVGRYHALCIKRAQMKGERPSVTEGKTDYII
ncbi:hypothetical protein GGR21_000752 [Dysgonomonas hofstadii]|jgi:hypothetical protein|uniref:Uncharacterized protein n=1 Tax=Dysgonomonas hofstadii TaxID=637886 RepID=A0A840CPH0_9BACT|nr:hypothetical protein [Dysgonomonas hofstadii]MBB4034865.1 hypothetical protein [Dysgonomonas hofstadii]